MFKRAIFVFLIVHIGLWIFGEDIAFSFEEEPIASIDSVTGMIGVIRKDQKSFDEAKENDQLYEGDIIVIMPVLSEIRLSHQLENQPWRIQIVEEKGKYNDKYKCKTFDQNDKHMISVEFPENGQLHFYLQEESYFKPVEEEKSGKLKSFLEKAFITIIFAPFPKSQKYGKKAGAREEHLLQAKIVDLVDPVGTKVMSRYPHFTWHPLQGIKKYEIIIFDGLGHVLWSHETTKTEIDYPQDAPILNPGEYYFWQVNGVNGSKHESERRRNLYVTLGIAYFTIMPTQQIEEISRTVREAQQQLIKRNSYEILTLYLGAYYEENQLYGEAQKEYEKLVRLGPTSNIYRKMLTNLYIKIGRSWAAMELLQE